MSHFQIVSFQFSDRSATDHRDAHTSEITRRKKMYSRK